MEMWWPWLTLAGLGILHGLSPANGWMFAAACGVQARSGARARRALLPIAIGHAVSIAIVVAVVAQGFLLDRDRIQSVAGALLIGVALYRVARRSRRSGDSASINRARFPTRTSDAGIALWSCLMTTVHGAGLMLVPALVPLCMSDSPARAITASGSMALALLAVGVHLAAMLVTTGAIATGVCRGVAMHSRLPSDAALRDAWTVVLAVTGLLVLAIR
jgi:hypothetical protein